MGSSDGIELGSDVCGEAGNLFGTEGSWLGQKFENIEGNGDGMILGPDDGSLDGKLVGRVDSGAYSINKLFESIEQKKNPFILVKIYMIKPSLILFI